MFYIIFLIRVKNKSKPLIYISARVYWSLISYWDIYGHYFNKVFWIKFLHSNLKLHCTTNLTVDGQLDFTYGEEEKHRLIAGELTRSQWKISVFLFYRKSIRSSLFRTSNCNQRPFYKSLSINQICNDLQVFAAL